MIEDFLRRPWVVARLRASVLGQDLDQLADELKRLGYRPFTIQRRLYPAGHLAHWLVREHIELTELNETTIVRFVEEHGPRCRCREPRGRWSDLRGVAPHLLKLLRERGRICPPPPVVPTPLDAILRSFTEHLEKARGAAPLTCKERAYHVRLFLEKTFGAEPIDFSKLTATALRRFVVERTAGKSPRTGRGTATALRLFLHFLHLQGFSDGKLVDAVPMVRTTRYSPLPVPLSSAELRKLLESIDRGKAVGLRDHAMVLCLAHLGLRAREVSELTLDSIDWRAGTVTIATSKARRASVQPLPLSIGQAIATYLRQGRPPTSIRQVFVRHLFPVGAPLRAPNVISAVQRAFRRSALEVPSLGAHTLRHTAATEMVRAGASLKAVADVLRHRSLDTTARYAKVDISRLREVAMPWPEVEP